MTVTDLRKALVSTGFAYKGERMRTEEFQRKLDGALLQLQRREEIEQKLEEAQEKNHQLLSQQKRLERERDREQRYDEAIKK